MDKLIIPYCIISGLAHRPVPWDIPARENQWVLLQNFGKELFGKDFRNQITDTVKAQKRSKELLFNIFQQQHTNKPFSKGPLQSKLHRGGKTLASSKEAIIPVPEECSTAAAMHYSKTRVTRTATFFKEITQLIPLGELSSQHHLMKQLFCNLKIPEVPLSGRLVHFLGSWKKTDKREKFFR